MERCQLAINLPSLSEKLPDPYTFHGAGSVAMLNVCELTWDSPSEMDLKDLSWATRPKCRQHVGTFAATPGSEVTLPEFPCLWGELRTYEVSCAEQNPDCAVDVWSSQASPWGKPHLTSYGDNALLTRVCRDQHVSAPDYLTSVGVSLARLRSVMPNLCRVFDTKTA